MQAFKLQSIVLLTADYIMKDKVFIDTNVLLYLYSENEQYKSEISKNALANNECSTSTQALNELSNICTKKWKIERDIIENAINEISTVCEIKIISVDTIKTGLYLHQKYGYSYYDCLMLSSALENGCLKIFTEDMSDGQIIESTLQIVNIFK